jgi:hypothetical protein
VRKHIKQIRDWANRNEGVIALIGVALAIVSPILQRIAPRVPSAVQFLGLFFQRYGPALTWIGAAIAGLALWSASRSHSRRLDIAEKHLQALERASGSSLQEVHERVTVLESRPKLLLDETIASSLSIWSYGPGQWRLHQDGLSVTNSTAGGICRIGTGWEDYVFSFDFKILNKCAAWIVRASSRDFRPTSYVMIQCTSDQIRPHKHFTTETDDGTLKDLFTPVDEIDHDLPRGEWHTARTQVIGNGIKVWINDEEVWKDPQVLANFPKGTVGFRQWGHEHALFRAIRVEKPDGA